MHIRHSLLDKVQELKSRLSDQNLMLLPEYEERIMVLQRVWRGQSAHAHALAKGVTVTDSEINRKLMCTAAAVHRREPHRPAQGQSGVRGMLDS